MDIERINIVKMLIHSKWFRFNPIPVRIPVPFSIEIENNLKIIGIYKRFSHNNLKIIKAWSIVLPDFKIYGNTTAIKIAWCCPKDTDVPNVEQNDANK